VAALESWRAGVAQEMGVAPYTVLGNSVLARIAERRPASRPELGGIPGVGPRTLAKFGDALLQIAGGRPRQDA
jgi:superfamily II DNA helicase RecQ